MPDKEFSHSNLISVIDTNGKIIHRQTAMGSSKSETIKVLSGL